MLLVERLAPELRWDLFKGIDQKLGCAQLGGAFRQPMCLSKQPNPCRLWRKFVFLYGVCSLFNLGLHAAFQADGIFSLKV